MSQIDQTNKAMLWAFNVDANVSTISTTIEHRSEGSISSGFNWFHIQSDAKDSKECLQGLGLQNEIIDALCTAETRPKAIQIGAGMLLYLRGINRNPDADPEDMVSLRLWISDNILISARRKDRQLLSVQDAKEELEKGYTPSSPLDLTLKIITKIADRISETVDLLDEDLTEFEALDKSAKQDRIKLSMIRRQAAAIRRYLAPQRDALDAMYRFNKSLNQQQAFELREQTDRMTRYVEDLDLAKERAPQLYAYRLPMGKPRDKNRRGWTP
jgi:zinc transporter